jgi:hypothetical protein
MIAPTEAASDRRVHLVSGLYVFELRLEQRYAGLEGCERVISSLAVKHRT